MEISKKASANRDSRFVYKKVRSIDTKRVGSELGFYSLVSRQRRKVIELLEDLFGVSKKILSEKPRDVNKRQLESKVFRQVRVVKKVG
jgi:hypothetical protein